MAQSVRRALVMTLNGNRIRADLAVAVAAADAAHEHRRAAERELWEVVRRSGHEPMAAAEIDAARAEWDRALEEARTADQRVVELQALLAGSNVRELSLLAVADAQLARERTRTMRTGGTSGTPQRRKGLLDFLRRR